MTQFIISPAFWFLIVGVLLVVAAVVYTRRMRVGVTRERAEFKKRCAELEGRCADLENRQAEEVAEAHSRAEAAMQSTLKSAMRTLQGLGNEQQKAIVALQDKYGESQVLQDLLDIDHLNSQFGRRAQSIAVLCGGFPGRQRSDALVYDVIRGAKGRIRQYKRVKIHSQHSVALVSRAVEPVALAMAELLDNATSYSAPDSPIDISIRAVPTGVCVIIDDSGVGMNDAEKDRAVALLSGKVSGVTGLGNPPQFGFAVIGVLAVRYGFSVSVDSTSPYGGVRAVVLLPEDLLTTVTEPQEPQNTQAQPAVRVPDQPASGESSPLPPAVSSAAGSTAGGLPKRQRKAPGSGAQVPDQRRPVTRSDAETATIMGAFQRGTQAGRQANTPHTEGDAR